MKTFRRAANLLREAHRSTRATGDLFYPITMPFAVTLLLPFFILEPDVFDHPDHV